MTDTRPRPQLPARRADRAAGVLLGQATGDALGAGYEFGSAPFTGTAEMIGGGLGGFAPGEWTDDTAQAVGIAEVTATGRVDLHAIGQRFLDWYADGPPDVGIQTRVVLDGTAGDPTRLSEVASDHHERHPDRSAGNGALMRTGPVALAHLGDDAAIAAAAGAVSALTHADPRSREACTLWCVALDRAVRQRRLDGIHDGLALLPDHRAAFWRERLAEAEQGPPERFAPNGFVVTALQAAYAATVHTPVPSAQPGRHLQDALHAAIAIGDDTDTVAAIAGQLLGARWGASAVPFAWRRLLHGWPGWRAGDLTRLAVRTVQGGEPDASGWPGPRPQPGDGTRYHLPLPGDDGLLLGSLDALPDVIDEVDAVVSLCRMGDRQVPEHLEHHEVLLVDQPGDDVNPNLELVLTDTAAALATLRADGKRVFLHCVGGASRTPTVAAVHLAERDGISRAEAWDRLAAVDPYVATHNPTFQAALGR